MRAEEIRDTRMKVFCRDGYRCQRCGKPAVFMAHRIAQTRGNIEHFGKKIIHHPFNIVAVCEDPACNDYFNIGFKTEQAQELARAIKREIEEGR